PRTVNGQPLAPFPDVIRFDVSGLWPLRASEESCPDTSLPTAQYHRMSDPRLLVAGPEPTGAADHFGHARSATTVKIHSTSPQVPCVHRDVLWTDPLT